MYNDKMIENINSKLQNLSSLVKNQLIFNKMIEAQIAQIAAAILVDHSGKILGQPENSPKFVHPAVEQ
jgi:GTP-sensing pleiotropic transcriptional regulator CodY